MSYMGIDVGKKGGIALIHSDTIIVEKMPPSVPEIANLIIQLHAEYSVKLCAIEKVSSMPGQGVKSMFTFGEGYGALQGILAARNIPHTFVRSQEWQAKMLDNKHIKDTKERSLDMARRLYPHLVLLKTHDGKADAIHLARYAKQFG